VETEQKRWTRKRNGGNGKETSVERNDKETSQKMQGNGKETLWKEMVKKRSQHFL
jgi:hypothetical protein